MPASSRYHPTLAARAGDPGPLLVLFVEYPGKQEFLQLRKIGHTDEHLHEADYDLYNLPKTARHFRTRQSSFELLRDVVESRFFAMLMNSWGR